MVLSRFRQTIAAIRGPRKGKAGGDRPDLSRHAAQIIDEMAVATFVLDRDGRVAVWNDACARLTGLEAAKVIGTKDHWKGFYLAARPASPISRWKAARRKWARSTPRRATAAAAIAWKPRTGATCRAACASISRSTPTWCAIRPAP